MNEAYRLPVRKIDPTKGGHLPDGTLNDNDRIEIGPTMLAYAEFEAAGLILLSRGDLAGAERARLLKPWLKK